MLKALLRSLQLAFRRRKYRTGAKLSEFIARDVKRDITILDDSKIEDGYVVALVRTNNILYTSNNLVEEADYGEPQIVHLNGAWEWGGERWGGTEPKPNILPLVSHEDFQTELQNTCSSTVSQLKIIDEKHRSWTLKLFGSQIIEYRWDPFFGFDAMLLD